MDQGIDKAANFIEERKLMDEQYRKERPQVIAKAQQEQEEADAKAIDKQIQVLCESSQTYEDTIDDCRNLAGY